MRLVAHFLQPHAPFAHCPERYEGYGHRTKSMWAGLRHGDWSEEQVWADYGLNLLYALDAVETLIENVSGRVVMTSDHGNLFDPLRIGFYSSPEYLLFRALKRVPWAVATGGGSEEYEVQPDEVFAATKRVGVRERLRDLGYVS